MRRNRKTLLVAIGAGSLLLIGGGAFTASLTNSGSVGSTGNDVLGYGTVDVTGANLTDLNYTFDDTGANITAVNFTTDADTHLETAVIGFNGTSVGSSCTATYTTSTAWVCTLTDSEAVTDVTSTDITVSPT